MFAQHNKAMTIIMYTRLIMLFSVVLEGRGPSSRVRSEMRIIQNTSAAMCTMPRPQLDQTPAD